MRTCWTPEEQTDDNLDCPIYVIQYPFIPCTSPSQSGDETNTPIQKDVLGYPNVEKLKQGVVEYVPSPVTVWDKELILIDELDRAIPELQSKWLEVIRSRKIMGFPTKVKWVWAAMNPMSYSATQALDEVFVGRFAQFICPPNVLERLELS